MGGDIVDGQQRHGRGPVGGQVRGVVTLARAAAVACACPVAGAIQPACGRPPSGTSVTAAADVAAVEWPTVSFQTNFAFPDGSLVTSSSTLRYRSRGEVLAALIDAGFEPGEVRDAPDRPGQEFVFLARRPHDSV
jgi:hypothetical protein